MPGRDAADILPAMRTTPLVLPKFHVVLVEPEIPPNTGAIARLCVGVGATLHLVGRLGFSTDDRALRRAGLDYWEDVDLHYHPALEDVWRAYPEARFYYASRKGKTLYTDIRYQEGDMLVFGKETEGLPDSLLDRFPGQTIRIPTLARMRSLNLANSVAVVAYELIRQLRVQP